MTGIFEVIASENQEDKLPSRRATAVAEARVGERFGSFLRGARGEYDFNQRLALVEDDLNQVVCDAAKELGASNSDHISQSLIENFKRNIIRPVKQASKEARRPRLCPYHNEVVGISLAQGEPRAGFDAMAQHAWSGKHCQGDEYEGPRCSFKPEMTTQSYWDNRAEQAEQRRKEREERQLEVEQEGPVIDELGVGEEAPQFEEDQAEFENDPSEINEELAEAPSAIGVGEDLAVAASLKGGSLRKEAPGDQHLPAASPKRNRQYEHIKDQCLEDGKSEEECKELAARTVNKQRAEHGETKSKVGAFGIPYAKVDPETGDRICPICEKRIPEKYDSTGESLTNAYSEHYQREHAKEAKIAAPVTIDSEILRQAADVVRGTAPADQNLAQQIDSAARQAEGIQPVQPTGVQAVTPVVPRPNGGGFQYAKQGSPLIRHEDRIINAPNDSGRRPYPNAPVDPQEDYGSTCRDCEGYGINPNGGPCETCGGTGRFRGTLWKGPNPTDEYVGERYPIASSIHEELTRESAPLLPGHYPEDGIDFSEYLSGETCPHCGTPVAAGYEDEPNCQTCGRPLHPIVNDPHDREQLYRGLGPTFNQRGGKTSEALETVDVTKDGEGPSPKIDKNKWTPESVKPIEGVDSPQGKNPSKHQDIKEPARPKNLDDEVGGGEIGNATTERQELPDDSSSAGFATERNIESNPTKTFPNRNQVNPVTSAVDKAIFEVTGKTVEALTAKDFRLIADAIRTLPGDQQSVAEHFAGYLAQTNPMFDRERFVNACLGEYNTRRDVHNDPVQGELGYREPEPSPEGNSIDDVYSARTDDVNKNPLKELMETGFDGFEPESEIQKALEVYKSSS